MLPYDMLKSLKNCNHQMLIMIGLKLWSSEGSLSVTWAFLRDANSVVFGDFAYRFLSEWKFFCHKRNQLFLSHLRNSLQQSVQKQRHRLTLVFWKQQKRTDLLGKLFLIRWQDYLNIFYREPYNKHILLRLGTNWLSENKKWDIYEPMSIFKI